MRGWFRIVEIPPKLPIYMVGAREVIEEYLKEHNIGPNTRIDREEIVRWCLENQERFEVNCTENTYKQQIGKMIMGSQKNLKEGHSDGYDDVFCPSSQGKSYVVTNKCVFW